MNQVNGARARILCWSFVAAISTLWFGVVDAAPYASAIQVSGTNVSFVLNESADSLMYRINGGPLQFLDGSTKGTKGFTLGSPTDRFSIIAGKTDSVGYTIPTGNTVASSSSGLSLASPEVGFRLVSDDANQFNKYNSPRGVAISTDPNASNFGLAYVANSSTGTIAGRTLGDGMYAVRPDGGDAFGYGDSAQNPNNSLGGSPIFIASANSPYRVNVGTDGQVYVSDWADANANAFMLNPNLTTGTNLLSGFNGTSGSANPDGTSLPAGENHGSIAGVYVTGSLAGNNLVLYTIDEDLNTAHVSGVNADPQNDRNSVWKYNIGGGPAPWSTMPTKVASGLIGNLAGGGVTVDMGLSPDASKVYMTQRRTVGAESGLIVTDSSGTTLFDSLSASRTLLGNPTANDILTNVRGMAVSPDGKWIALTLIGSDIALLPLVNGIPNLAGRVVVNSASPDVTTAEDVAFDAAGNLHYVSTGQGLYRVLAPGGTTYATTTWDGSAYSFLLGSGLDTTKYWDVNGATPGAGGPTTSGTWDTATSNWSTSAGGDIATTTFNSSDTAVFSAGNDSVDATITLASPQTVGGLIIKDGTIRFSNLSSGIVLGTNPAQVNQGAVLSIPNSNVISVSSGHTLTLDGGTLQNTLIGGGSGIYNPSAQILLSSNGGTINTPNGGSSSDGINSTYSIMLFNGNIGMTGGTVGATLHKTGHGEFRGLSGWTFTTLDVQSGLYRINASGGSDTGFGAATGTVMVAGGALENTTNGAAVGTSIAITSPATRSFVLTGVGATPDSMIVLNAAWTINGSISGPGGLILNGWARNDGGGSPNIIGSAATLTLGGSNTYGGGTNIGFGTLVATGGSAIPNTSRVTFSTRSNWGGNGGSATTTLNTSVLRIDSSETIGSLAGGNAVRGSVNLNGAGINLTTGADNTSSTYDGVVVGAGSLTKGGTGTFTLTGSNTYSGGTTINAGTLLVNNSSGSGTGTGAVNVLDGTLGGTGIIGGTVSIGAGAHLAPGASAGTLSTLGAVSLSSGTALDYDLANTTTVGSGVNDLLAITGGLSLGSSLSLNLNAYQGDLSNGTYKLITYTGALTGDMNGWTINSNNVSSAHNYSFSSATPGEIQLIVSAADSNWTGSDGGDFEDSAYWNPQAPTSGSRVIFNLAQIYTVRMNQDTTNRELLAQDGDVNVDLQGHTYTLANQLRVGGATSSTFRLSNGNASADYAVASTSTGNAQLIVNDANLTTSSTGLFDVGAGGGHGSLLVSGTSLLQTGYMRVGENTGSNGLVQVIGAQTHAEVNGMQIGATGTGHLEVRDGALFHSTSPITLANFGGTAVGDVLVTGSGSQLNVDSGITVGQDGNGTLSVLDGASVSTGYLRLAQADLSAGNVLVDGTGSQLQVNGDVSLANGASLSVTGGGSFTKTGFGSFQVIEGSTFTASASSIEAGTTTIYNGSHVAIGSFLGNNHVTVADAGSSLHVSGNYQQTNGTFNLFGGASFQADGTFTYSGNVDFNVTGGSTFSVGNAAASSIQAGQTAINNGASVVVGTFSANNNVGVADAGSSLHVMGNYQQTGGDFLGSNGATVQTDGDFTYATAVGANLNITGGSALKVGSTFRLSEGNALHVDGTSSVVVGSGAPQLGKVLVGTGGTLRGRGTISTPVIVDGGRVAPGSSPGILHIDGSYTQTTNGVLEIEVGGVIPGTQHDQVVVTGNPGTALLAGRLEVPIISSFVPGPGDDITILTATSSVTGSFDSIFSPNLASVSPGLAIRVVYNPSDVHVQFAAPSTDIQFTSTVATPSWSDPATWQTGSGAGAVPDSVNIVTVQNPAGVAQTVTVASADAFVHELSVIGNANTITVNVQNGNSLSSTAGTSIGSQAVIALGTAGAPTDRGSLVSSTIDVNGGGRLSGNGTVVGDLSVGKLTATETATLSPGFSVGHLDVKGSYKQGTSGTLLIDVEGANAGQYDSINVSEGVEVGGTLRFVVSSPTAVHAGDTITFVSAGDVVPGKTYKSIETVGLSDLIFTVHYPGAGPGAGAAETGRVLSGSVYERGDMNHDLAVNSTDASYFALAMSDPQAYFDRSLPGGALISDFGQSMGDFSHDGRLDFDDIPLFAARLGMSASAFLAAMNAVPEPASIVVALMAVCSIPVTRRRRFRPTG